MTHALNTEFVLAIAGSLLYILLGLWVFTLTPRRRQTTLLGTYAVLFGLVSGPTSILLVFDVIQAGSFVEAAIQIPIRALVWVAALGLAWFVPAELEDRRLLAPALAVGVAVSAAWVGLSFGWAPFSDAPVSVLGVVQFVNLAVGYTALVLIPLRAHPDQGASPEGVTQLAILTLAFATFAAVFWARRIPQVVQGLSQGSTGNALGIAAPLVGWFVIAGLWLRNMAQAGDDTRRAHAAAAGGILVLTVAGALYQLTVGSGPLGDEVVERTTRTLGVGLLAYGVLRHDLAGLDAKVRFGVSKTTVAGIFVAVFFVVSEGAQILFAEFAGSEFLGILAAGALLFVLAPIQRMADRIAETAVPAPGSAPSGTSARRRPEETYKKMVRKFVGDDELSREEEQALADLAGELGLDPSRAFELRSEVEDEIDAEDGDAP